MKIILDKNKIIYLTWYCAAVKHQSHNFGAAVHDDNDDISFRFDSEV